MPLFESKMIHQYDHRWASWNGRRMERMTDACKHNAEREALPRYFAPRGELERRLGEWKMPWLLVARSITRPTEVRSLLATIVPRTAVGNSLNVLFPRQASLTAVLSWIALSGLPMPYHPVFNVPRFAERGSQDGLFLAIESADPKFDRVRTTEFLRGLGARNVDEIEP